MANPMKAIKAVTRVVGGITGKGSKSVNPTYKATQTIKLKNTSAPGVLEERVKNYTVPSAIRQMKETGVASKAEAKANKRGLKAANKPLSKGNAKRVENIGGKINFIAMDRRPTPPSIKKIYDTNKNFGAFKAPEQVREGMRAVYAEAKKIAMAETRKNSIEPKRISPAQKALNKKRGK